MDRRWSAAGATVFVVALLLVAPAASAATPYSNDFEVDIADWDVFGGSLVATRVPSGTHGITSASGSWHAENSPAGSASAWGGYNFGAGDAVPTVFHEYSTSVDIYLDVAGAWTNDMRFDFSSAINNSLGTHRRDFIFNAGFYNDTDGSPGSGTSRFVISASNNSQPGSAFAKNPGRDPIAISASGWYNFEHHFYDNAGALAVDMSIYDASHVLVHSWTLSDPSDLISVIGGNRYGWFDYNQFSTLAFDDAMRFEPEPQCTTVCYADDDGNDANGGASAADAKKTIQAALDQVSADGEVRVLPGNYSETAADSTLTPANGGGTYQFGLFFPAAKPGVTVLGVTAGDDPITSAASVAATVDTNATNNFGPSGIFVEADGVTIQGLRIGTNSAGQNKTIEVIGDDFTLDTSEIADPDGSVYINDWVATASTSHVQSYHILDNLFDPGVSLDIANGPGISGSVSERVVSDNSFDLGGGNWPAISFTGADTGVPWFVYQVGGAAIQGNSFSEGEQYIRARGTYPNAEFDWQSYWVDNTFDKAVVALADEPSFDVRTYSYPNSYGTFDNVRRIGATIQDEVDHTVAGDTVLVADGTYDESPRILHSLALESVNGRDATTIELQTGPTYTGALEIGGAGSDVTVDGFTIRGRDAACPTLATTNVLVDGGPDAVVLTNNRFEIGEKGDCSTGDDGFGFVTTYSTSVNLNSLTVEGNLFVPLNTRGTRAFYVNPGTDTFTFRNNEVTGEFSGTAITQAMDGLVEGNAVDGQDLGGRGLGTWGYPDATVWGSTVFRDNVLTGLASGINVNESNDVLIEGNEITNNVHGVRVLQPGDAANFDPTTVEIHQNNITGNSTAGVENAASTAGAVDAECNWWGEITGPTNVGSPTGTGDDVVGSADFQPWLVAAAPGGACISGTWTFQGFFSPVDNPPDFNMAKAGQSIPLKWRILDDNLVPIDDPSAIVSITSDKVSCADLSDAGDPDVIESYSGGSGLQSKGDGNWQFNWLTPSTYQGTCRVIEVTLGDGSVHTANFKFKP